MNPAKWQNIKNLLSATLDLPESERDSFLARENDEELRREVEKLLDALDKAEDFIEKPILIEQGVAEDESNDVFIGKNIENYLILEKIGAGGMGAVYLAEKLNSDFKQKVALKIIKRGMDSELILKRFATERRILSSLKHPNIAQLIDGGISSENLPFFVMEFVEGKPLNEFCRENNLSLEERLEIFRRICAAVEHAHKNLVIHRDLKPANILVTEDKIPKLLDFGIAKLLAADDSETTITMTQGKMFTPEYASPEQILGKTVTTSTDVYSLGVILYELLTQHRPFDTKGKSFDEIVKNVCETEPPRPSATLENQFPTTETEPQTVQIPKNKLRGDLDNIILKALRKEPTERYGSVQQLSEDVSRFLRGLPILARPQTMKYRFGKYFKRHKIGVLAAALVLVSLFTGISVATWQAIIARRERAKAEQRFKEVRQIANTVLFDYYDKIKDLPGTIELRQKIVLDTIKYLDNLAADNTDDISLKRELARAYDKVSEVQFGLNNGNIGDSSGSLKSAAKALELAEQVVADKNSTLEDRRFLADMYVSLAGARGETGDLQADVDLKKKAIEIYEKIYNAEPNDVKAENDLAKGYFFIATPMKFIGDTDGAIENLQKSAEIYKKLEVQVPNEPKYRRNVALSYKYLPPLFLRQGKTDEAVKASQNAAEIDEKRLNSAPNDLQIKYDLSRSYEILAESFLEKKDIKNAENFALKAVGLVKEVAETDPKNSYYQDGFGLSIKVLSNVRQRQNQPLEAIKLTKQAVEIWEQTVKKDATDIFTKVNLAKGYAQIGESYVMLAEISGNVKTRRENFEIAKNWFQKSGEIWRELEKNQTIFAFNKKDFEKVAIGLEKCEKYILSNDF